ncbi:hypothetical protein Trco_004561 [Trichoderma cornu-damae]|uniref:Uncharacterized protein n=1 Tax=Trichoderma cornu-damae TaxID=654480 RepID=A0A9P8QT48_9HYPO|nr:hypothetical protein Trco_004561 [Trichoderma cornu-damae]
MASSSSSANLPVADDKPWLPCKPLLHRPLELLRGAAPQQKAQRRRQIVQDFTVKIHTLRTGNRGGESDERAVLRPGLPVS